ncbi:hypothetical protein [Millionella massiliensis]|uniref:hypothetical protein n=1 Tax=Millionella massiliensis TaxID=1871023 RepID=UPI0008DAAB6F|nr:hypothetical protein [Millionella massiliensis]
MIAINTIPQERYADLLAQAMGRVRQKLSKLIDEECSKMIQCENQGDDEKALIHEFNIRALQKANNAITLSPNQILRIEKTMTKKSATEK